MADDTLQLSPTQIVDERPFTHPTCLDEDRAVLASILECLRGKMHTPAGVPDGPCPMVILENGQDGRRRRVVICDPEQLAADRPITVVGFFGLRRPGVDRTPLDRVDEELIAGFPKYPGVLSYCSFQQASGDWANLVLLRGPADLDHWSTSPRHAFAAKAMAPDYYLYVRLHNACLEGGVLSRSEIVFQRTKYFDFQETPPWRAIRELI